MENYDAFITKYVDQIKAKIGKVNGDRRCAEQALKLLTSDFEKNIRGCYHGLWQAADNLDYGLFELKVEGDVQRNIKHITAGEPNQCVKRYLFKFGTIIFEGIQNEVMDYASR